MIDVCGIFQAFIFVFERKNKMRNLSKHNILFSENLSLGIARISVVPQKLVVRKVTWSILGSNQEIGNSVGISQSVDRWYMTTIYYSTSDWHCQRRLTICMTIPDTLASGTSVIVSENDSLHRYHVYRSCDRFRLQNQSEHRVSRLFFKPCRQQSLGSKKKRWSYLYRHYWKRGHWRTHPCRLRTIDSGGMRRG